MLTIILVLTLTPNFLCGFDSRNYMYLLYIYFYNKVVSQLGIVYSPQFKTNSEVKYYR